jgi:hypothetical protein
MFDHPRLKALERRLGTVVRLVNDKDPLKVVADNVPTIVAFPVVLKVPFTSKVAPGVVVFIPKLPFAMALKV